MARKNLGNKRREKIYLRFNGKCADCGKFCVAWWDTYNGRPFRFRFKQIQENNNCSPATHEIHHIIPLADGGSDSENNLLFLCSECHKKRHHAIKRGVANYGK